MISLDLTNPEPALAQNQLKDQSAQAVSHPIMRSRGFTLIELMIVLGVIAILVAVALPSYFNYTSRSHYAEILSLIGPYRYAVEECIASKGSVTGCNLGTNNIPTFTGPIGQLRTLTIRNGVITARPVVSHGIKNTDTYILRPTVNASTGQVTWRNTGSGCLTTNMCKPYP